MLKPCDDPKVARRRMQYRNVRARRLGRPLETEPVLVAPRVVVVKPRAVRLVASIETHVDRSGGLFACWPWQGNRDENGYGRMRVAGRMVRTHRRALELALGRPIRAGYGALHHCDNPPCCNPTHLYEGTPADNVHDAIARGRKIASQPLLSLTVTPEIPRLGVDEAAARFGVSRRTVYRTLQRARMADAA